MSDALVEDAPAGASVGGRLSVDPCARCGHRHKRADTSQGIVEWITSCPECGCRASQDEYEGNAAIVPIRAGADELGAEHRDYDHRCGDACVTSACGDHHLAGACRADVGHRDARGTRSLVRRESVRGVGELACGRVDLWGRTRDLLSQLGQLRGLGLIRPRVGGES